MSDKLKVHSQKFIKYLLICIILTILSVGAFLIIKKNPQKIPKKFVTIKNVTVNGVKFEMVNISPGNLKINFLKSYDISGLRMMKYEVTIEQWRAIMGKNPSKLKMKGPLYPVTYVSWLDCQQFISQLNRMTRKNFRLPTDIEWQYACRAGREDDNFDNIATLAWYSENSQGLSHPIGEKQPNAFGLYDMLGNVWEWCDGNAMQKKSIQYPQVQRKIIKGGSFKATAININAKITGDGFENLGYKDVGLRLILE